jgi:hypothetical protein
VPEYIVHIERHCGWHTTTAEGETFAEAAVAAVVATCKQFGLDLDSIPHTVEYGEEDLPQTFGEPFHYRRVLFREASERRVFDPILNVGGWGMTKPGDHWTSCRVEEGKPGDCPMCGGTSVDFHNPFVGCWKCTDGADRFKRDVAKAADHG